MHTETLALLLPLLQNFSLEPPVIAAGFDRSVGRIVCEDFDGNGAADTLVFGPNDAPAYLALSSGGIAPSWSLVDTGLRLAWVNGATTGDFDSDGDFDVVASHDNGKVSLLRNNGLTAPWSEEPLVTSRLAGEVVAGDFDLDGLLDVAFAGFNNDLVYVLLNSGSQAPWALRIVGRGIPDGNAIAAGDEDGDGDLDLFVSATGTQELFLLSNPMSAAQWPDRVILLNAPESLATGDLNGDGRADLLTSGGPFGPGRGPHIWVADTSGGSSFWFNSGPAREVRLADVDLDGDLDCLLRHSARIDWIRNSGSSSFDLIGDVLTAIEQSTSFAVSNVDSDNRSDVMLFDLPPSSSRPAALLFAQNGLDSDADGLADIREDLNLNGAVDLDETDWLDQDSDDDGLSDGEEALTSRPDPRWLLSPTGEFYRLAGPMSWSQSSGAARAVGADLVSIRSRDEQEWLISTFGSTSDEFWIGLSDFSGTFEWSDGRSLNYTNWGPGEPANSFCAAFIGLDTYPEPGAWYTEVAGAGNRRSIWRMPGTEVPQAYTDPLAWDTDGDGISDGLEDGLTAIIWDGDLDGDGVPDVKGTDPGMFQADADPQSTTSPLDIDSDDDGLLDGAEDIDRDGAQSLVETAAELLDSDGDGLPDGLEQGLEFGTVDTDGRAFLSDDDPTTTTNPLIADSDSGGVPDGVEDHDQNGAVDTWDTDPNDPGDEALAVYFSGIRPGGQVHIEVWNATPNETIIPAYSLAGPGPSPTGLGINVDLTRPITLMDPFLSDASGRASVDRLPVPASAPPGLPVWMQAVEVPISGNLQPRASNPVLIPVGAN